MKVLCINDKNFPNEIPISKRVRKDEIYTVIDAEILRGDGGKLGYKLEEIDLSDCAPYLFFAASRFRPVSDPAKEEIEEELLMTA